LRHADSLIPKPDPVRSERRVASLLFLATSFTVFMVRWFRWQPEGGNGGLEGVATSLVFTGALMGILLAHEMGHYLVAQSHQFRLSLPWFIPFPFLVGTLGAIIRLRQRPKTRSGLLEMAGAGPLAGMVVIVVCVVASMVLENPPVAATSNIQLSTPLIFSLVSVMCGGPWEVWVSPLEPLAFSAWIGCLVTALNLLPFGQLDGGHILCALVPGWSKRMSWIVTVILLVGGIFWAGWLAWVVALHLLGTRHPMDVRNPSQPPSRRACMVGLLCSLAWCLCFTPVPFFWKPM